MQSVPISHSNVVPVMYLCIRYISTEQGLASFVFFKVKWWAPGVFAIKMVGCDEFKWFFCGDVFGATLLFIQQFSTTADSLLHDLLNYREGLRFTHASRGEKMCFVQFLCSFAIPTAVSLLHAAEYQKKTLGMLRMPLLCSATCPFSCGIFHPIAALVEQFC